MGTLRANTTSKLFWVHVPKCGGSSIREALHTVYGDKLCRHYRNEEHLDPAAIVRDYTCIYGHYPVDRFASYDGLRITWVRHPIARLVSHYFFWKYTTPHELDSRHQQFKTSLPSIVDFAEQEYSTGAPSTLAYFLSGLSPRELDFVGFCEYMDEDWLELQLMLGKQLPTLGWRNKTAYYGTEHEHLTPPVLQTLHEITQDDYIWFKEAIELRGKDPVPPIFNIHA